MAIDKNKTRELLKTIDGLAESILPKDISADTKKWILTKVFGPAMEDIKKLVDDSRPPVIFLMGRSGHGKSSIVNALANKKVAETSTVKPGTKEITRFEISFEEAHSSWTIYDSRGYFETCEQDSESFDNSKILLLKSIVKCKPDVLLHVISMTEVRNLSMDIQFIKEISHTMHTEYGSDIPTLIVLNNADLLGDPDEWPPEKNAVKSGLIKEEIEYLVKDILKIYSMTPTNNKNSLYGVNVTDNTYLGVIPTCALWENNSDERWNIENLVDYIGNNLPDEALLLFSQAIKRKHLLQKISNSLIKRFTTLAGSIGANPLPVGDIFILTPLQILLIVIIAGLSCRDINKSNYEKVITEFSTATSIVVGGGMALRELARWILDATGVGIPVAALISGAIAGAGTYSIGKLAEAYFFYNEIKNPKELYNEGEKYLKK